MLIQRRLPAAIMQIFSGRPRDPGKARNSTCSPSSRCRNGSIFVRCQSMSMTSHAHRHMLAVEAIHQGEVLRLYRDNSGSTNCPLVKRGSMGISPVGRKKSRSPSDSPAHSRRDIDPPRHPSGAEAQSTLHPAAGLRFVQHLPSPRGENRPLPRQHALFTPSSVRTVPPSGCVGRFPRSGRRCRFLFSVTVKLSLVNAPPK